MGGQTEKAHREPAPVAAWVGIAAPLLFVAVFTLEGWLRPGYDAASMYVSALSLGPRGWIQIANFLLLGGLLLLFARGVAVEFPTGKAARGGPLLLAVMAILFIVSGPLVMDPMGTPLGQITVHGTLHGLAGGIIFILMPVTCFVFLRRFRMDQRWQAFSGWTLAIGIIVTVAVLLLTITSKSPSLQNRFEDWQGLIQRSIIVPFMFWLLHFACRIHRSIRLDSQWVES
jgi:hypothetical protein